MVLNRPRAWQWEQGTETTFRERKRYCSELSIGIREAGGRLRSFAELYRHDLNGNLDIRPDGRDPLALHQDDLVLREGAGFGVDQTTGADCGRSGCLGRYLG